MNRLSTLVVIGLAGLLAGCGSSTTSSTKPPANTVYSVNVTPDRLTLDTGDYTSISAVVDESTLNSTPKAITPQPTLQFNASSSLVSISPAGSVCAGKWDTRYEICTPGIDVPVNPITLTAYDAAHDVYGTTQLWVHRRAASITLTAPSYPTHSAHDCVSQNSSVTYIATAFDSSGTAIPNCSNSSTAGCVNNLDYTWSTADSTVASAGIYGGVVAVGPGVTGVYAKLNGTVSLPQNFATCPPAGIVMTSSAYNKGVPVAPFSTADLDTLAIGSTEYLNTTYGFVVDINNVATPTAFVDINGSPMYFNTLPLTFLSSSLLTGSFVTLDSFTSRFTANTSGRTILSVSCTPPACNPSISDFVSPTGTLVTAKSMGYGYPIYSNVIGATVVGSTGSTVLLTGTTYSDGVTSAHQLLTYDSESLALTHTIEVANLPNSLVVAPNGTTAYIGSDEGLVVVNLSNFQSAILTYPIVGDTQTTDQVTGKVLGVSPDSRYVLISDTIKQVVFLIDTTGTKMATRYAIPNIRDVAFSTDGYEFWIAGDSGVYVYESNSFIKTPHNVSSNVTAIAWALDGQSYFATGNSDLDNYSTCDDAFLQTIGGGSPVNLSSTAIDGVPRIFGLGTADWLDYSVSSPSQVSNTPNIGNVCLSLASGRVVAQQPVKTPSTLRCTPTQFSFSPRLEQEFVTGVDSTTCSVPESVVHGYNLATKSEALLTASSPIIPLSGGILNDGRELYIGTWDSVAKTAALHRFNLLSVTGSTTTPGTLAEDVTPISVPLVPSFVAVVPK